MKQLKLFSEIRPSIEAYHGDCKDHLKFLISKGTLVDSIVTDPPYELGFMGKSWDSTGIAYDREVWELCLQVLKPGGHLLAFGGSRTYHRMACAIEDAGFEIRDQIMWIYGQGFPKSLNVSKAIDKLAGAEREVIGFKKDISHLERGDSNIEFQQDFTTDSIFTEKKSNLLTAPTTDAAKQWDGWGSALKPAHEPICMARKPLSEKNIASNVLKHGTGGINVDGCRVGTDTIIQRQKDMSVYHGNSLAGGQHHGKVEQLCITTQTTGRFPANLIHNGSEEVLEEFAKYGDRKVGDVRPYKNKNRDSFSGSFPEYKTFERKGDVGTAARFFYSAKSSKRDRCGSKHPTVKPISLMRYLCRLVTPPNGVVLDPFAGTGTTGQAARDEGFHSILIEKEEEYYQDILRRVSGE